MSRNTGRKRTFNTQEVRRRITENDLSGSEFELSSSSNDSDDDSDVTMPIPVQKRSRVVAVSPAVGTPAVGSASVANSAYDWQPYDDLDCFHPEWIGDYKRRRSILVDTSDYLPVNYFQLFCPDSVFDVLETEVNRFASQKLDQTSALPPHSRHHSWQDTDAAEMKAYVAMNIAMGLCTKPAIPDYWSTYWLTKTPFNNIMSRNRYQLLSSFLHFNNNENQIARGEPGYNPLFKVQPLLDIVDPLYESVYVPGRNLSIDESIVKFKGRVFFRQYLPAKPTKWGLKEFVLCEAGTGYHLKHLIYTGKSAFPTDKSLPFTTQIVTSLLEGYRNQGHVVFMDNYYTSPDLFETLERNFGIGSCGTVRPNRRNMPSFLLPTELKLKKGDDPVFARSNNLVACAWLDTKRVHFLSNVHTNLTIDKRIRCKTSETGHRNVEKPVMAEVYNQHMSGVDLLDQKLGSYMYPHKCQKWYYTLFHRILEVALVNGYVVYCGSTEDSVMPVKRFREKVIDGLLEGYTAPKVKTGRRSPMDPPMRLTAKHFVSYLEGKSKPDCVVCSDRASNRRKQTSYCCKDCGNIPLCVTPCFERYHTVLDYRK